MVFMFLLHVKNYFYTVPMTTPTHYADLIKIRSRIYVPAFQLCCKKASGFQETLVSCESGFQKPLRKATGVFQLARYDCEHNQKGFHIHNLLTENR
jgi:hypothetical protein